MEERTHVLSSIGYLSGIVVGQWSFFPNKASLMGAGVGYTTTRAGASYAREAEHGLP